MRCTLGRARRLRAFRISVPPLCHQGVLEAEHMTKHEQNGLRIVAIEPCPSRVRGGQARALFGYMSGLKKRGYDVQLLYESPMDYIEAFELSGMACHQIERTWVDKKFSIRQWVELLRSSAHPAFRDADLIYVNQFFDLPLACLAKRRYGAKILCHLQIPPMRYGAQHRLCLNQVDGYMVSTRRMKEAYIRAGWPRDKLFIVPLGFAFPDEKPSQIKRTDGGLRLLYLGRITPAKGVDTCLDIVERLAAKGIPVSMDIYGPTLRDEQFDYKKRLEERVARGRLPVRIHPPVPDPMETMKGYDVVLFPSKWDEPFGLVLVEAVMAGVPVVARDVGSVREIMGPAFAPWVFKDAEDATEQVERIFNQSEPYRQDELFNHVKGCYDWSVVMPQFESLLTRVTGKS